MSEYDRMVDEFKKNCKETKYEELQKVTLKKARNKKQKILIRQTNMMLHQLIHGRPMAPYALKVPVGSERTISQGLRDDMRLKVPIGSGATQKELDMLQWFEGAENEFDYSLTRQDFKYDLTKPLTDREFVYRLNEPLTEREYAYRVESPASSVRERSPSSTSSYYGSNPFDGSDYSFNQSLTSKEFAYEFDSPVGSIDEAQGDYGTDDDSPPVSVKEEFAVYGKKIKELTGMWNQERISDDEYIKARQRQVQAIEDSRKYYKSEMRFERASKPRGRTPATEEEIARTSKMGRIPTYVESEGGDTETHVMPDGTVMEGASHPI